MTGTVVDNGTNVWPGRRGGYSYPGTTVTTVIADANGVYTFPALDPGTAIVAVAPGYAPNSPAVTVTVVTAQTLNETTNPELRIRLTPVPPGSIRGLVIRTSDNAPLESVSVALINPLERRCRP